MELTSARIGSKPRRAFFKVFNSETGPRMTERSTRRVVPSASITSALQRPTNKTRSPTDWRPHADDVPRDAGTVRSLSGRYGLTAAEWCGDRCRLRVNVWRSSASGYADALVSEGLPVGRLESRHARRFSYRWADPRNG